MARKSSMSRTAFNSSVAAFASIAAIFSAVPAEAISLRVKLACAKDYYAHCSTFKPNTPEVRNCMRTAGAKLSGRCVNALVADGEVSQQEVTRRAARASAIGQ